MATAEVVICGAGISGLAVAFHLAVEHGLKNVVLIDERPPLTLTSDKSSEAYRNWWPDPAMVALMNRSIDWLESWARQSGNRFLMNRRGYVYFTADRDRAVTLQQQAEAISKSGAGDLRIHRDRHLPHCVEQCGTTHYAPIDPHGFEGQPDGADLLLDPALIHERFPYVNQDVVAALHARRCGWFSGQQLGMFMLEEARAQGVQLLEDRVIAIGVKANRVETIRLASGTSIETRRFVNAAGPYLKHIGALLGIDLPVINERHVKIAFKDHAHVVPRDAPLLIWLDPQYLAWTAEERSDLATSAETRWLLEQLPDGVHLRPEGGGDSNVVLMLWAYHVEPRDVIVPVPLDEFFPEVVVRGLATMIPGLRVYFGKGSIALYDGGYYTRTPENRPLAGPLPIEGAYVCGALSGHGLMASAAVGELVAAHITGSRLPDYAAAFDVRRYADPTYQAQVLTWGASGQL